MLFGGAGRAYDRNVFDYLALERSKGTFPTLRVRLQRRRAIRAIAAARRLPRVGSRVLRSRRTWTRWSRRTRTLGREINLINNDLKTPYSDQFSLGMRNRFDLWNQTGTRRRRSSYVESKDGIVFLLGNRRGNGSFRENPPARVGAGAVRQRHPGARHAASSSTTASSRARRRCCCRLEKPYTSDRTWGVTFAYTYTDAEENRTNSGLNDEHFILDYPDGRRASAGTRRPACRGIAWSHRDLGRPVGPDAVGQAAAASPVEFEALNCRDVPTAAERPPGLGANNSASSRTSSRTRPSAASSSIWRSQKDFDLGDFGRPARRRAQRVQLGELGHLRELPRLRRRAAMRRSAMPTAWRQPTRTFKLSFNVGWR